MVTSAGTTGPAIRCFDDAPPMVMLRLLAAADANASASACGLCGSTAPECNMTWAVLSLSGKPLLYAAWRTMRKDWLIPFDQESRHVHLHAPRRT